MDLVENVGRRARVSGDQGDFIDVGIFSVNGRERNALYTNDGAGVFRDTAFPNAAARIEDARGLGAFDLEGDGDIDFVINNYLGPARLLVNRASQTGRHSIRLRLVGTESNRSAIGARVTIEHGERRQSREVCSTAGYLSGQSLSLHFGLGESDRVDRMTVHWPSGLVQSFRGIAADALYVVEEGAAWLRPFSERERGAQSTWIVPTSTRVETK